VRINADDRTLWAADIARSVEMYNEWFRAFAPVVYQRERARAADSILRAMTVTRDFTQIDAATLMAEPGILPALRMATCPPVARDRVTGLSGSTDGVVSALDFGKPLPGGGGPNTRRLVGLVADVLNDLLDVELFPWLTERRAATEAERRNAAAVVADRLCGANADPIIRNAQEERQLQVIASVIAPLGYRREAFPAARPLTDMPAGTYAYRMVVMVGPTLSVKLPIDVVIQPLRLRADRLPVLIEAKSAGDFTNTNKRRKEEAQKHAQLQERFGRDVLYVLFLCGYFGDGYLAYEADSGMDFIWEHRPDDLLQLGL
jgi:hypothetical protein